MKIKIYLLLSIMLACTFFTGCRADDIPQEEQEIIQIPQEEQEIIQIPQEEQEIIQIPQGEQEIIQIPQGEQEIIQDPQGGQEIIQDPQDGQEIIQDPQEGQEIIQDPQDGQELIQTPQVPTEELSDDEALLYEAFLKNELGVANPFVEGMELTVMSDEIYESEFEDAQKTYAYVDVNGDEKPELIFRISSYPDELMFVLGIYDNELVCFDVFETHTSHLAFGVYDYGLVWEGQNYDGFETILYTYTADGQPVEARRFTEEDDADLAAHEGEEPEWIDWP